MTDFDAKKFMTSAFAPREKTIKVSELKAFFPEGVEAEWKVRGLTGEECARVNGAIDKNDTLLSVLATLNSSDNTEKTNSLKELLGLHDNDVPSDIIRRKEMLTRCSVDPVCSEELAVKLAQTFPTVFFQLTTEIQRLTGLGQEPGKRKPSGKKQASKKA